MTHRFLTYILMAAAGCIPVFGADTTPKGWETIKTEATGEAKTVVKEQEIEIRTAPLSIFVIAPQSVQIKVFTILGRLVSEGNLPAGSSRLSLPAHGVYIIKTGTLTCKVAV
ncbi:MAG: T9SS type A sorting domain-containing protein [Muribaculaceae bacterium]|nr:T9SS type A sorting domain-containing protein [Muribaculaceae bacterium]